MTPHVSYHRRHRITVSESAHGYVVFVESVGIRERFGHFKHDWDAHAAAVEAIDELLGKPKAEKRLKKTLKKRLGNTPEPTEKGVEFFGKRLQWARLTARMSIERLAVRSGITKRQFVIWENGEASPSFGSAQRLSKALDCNAEWLYNGNGASEMTWSIKRPAEK